MLNSGTLINAGAETKQTQIPIVNAFKVGKTWEGRKIGYGDGEEEDVQRVKALKKKGT